jgi:non-homologous end joining protein Ku
VERAEPRGQFHDEYQARVQQLVDSKEKGVAPPKQESSKRLAPVVDLMAALKKSIAGAAAPKKLRKSA